MVMGEFTEKTEVLIIGSGPGGYAAAFRGADLGLDVTMVDMETRPGGVCLFRGCIPSKTYLYLTELIHQARQAKEMGISFGEPRIDLKGIKGWKDKVVDKLADSLAMLTKKRGVQLLKGRAVFEGSDTARLLDSDEEVSHIKFQHAIIATGSHPTPFPGTTFKKGSRIMDSTGALALPDIPEKLLVVGGGYVGVELGSVYATLGSRVVLVEMSDGIMMGADRDLVNTLKKKLDENFESIHVNTKVKSLEEKDQKVHVTFEGEIENKEQKFDRVLVAIGRRPNSNDLGLELTGVETDKRGFIVTDEQRHTRDSHIYAIGDVAGGVMLAHKAMFEGRVAMEVIAGVPSAFDVRAIPAVVYTDPQLAWCGMTEREAREKGVRVKITRFPWSASGRAAVMGASKGLTKMIIDEETGRILGLGIVGREAGEMIAEGVLAVEMGALAEDLALTIHPHPTLSEGEEETAEAFLGSAIHILSPKK